MALACYAMIYARPLCCAATASLSSAATVAASLACAMFCKALSIRLATVAACAVAAYMAVAVDMYGRAASVPITAAS